MDRLKESAIVLAFSAAMYIAMRFGIIGHM